MRKLKQWRKSEAGLFFPQEIEYLEHLIFEEKVHMEGALSIFAYPGNAREEAVLLDQGHNLIVDSGREAIAALQRHTIDGGTAGGTYDLGWLALGNGSNGGIITPVPATTALTNETTGLPTCAPRKALTVTTPGPPFITNIWSAQIGPTEYNDTAGAPPLNEINEAALFCVDTVTMFSMRAFANQFKSAGITFEFRWTVIF